MTEHEQIVRVGDLVKLLGERGWWKCYRKRRGWLLLAQDRGKNEYLISVLETTVTAVAHEKAKES